MTKCHICEKKISCKCSSQKNTKLKYRDCFSKNIYNETYPQAHLDFDNRECHICSQPCVGIFLKDTLDKLSCLYIN